MRIAINKNVSSNKKWYPVLDIILMYVESGRHGFDPAQSINLLSSEWVRSRSADVADVIRLATVERATDNLIDSSLVVLDDDCPAGGYSNFAQSMTTVNPFDAILFLSTPFQIILENEVFDGAFLLWMAKALNFTKFIDAYRSGRFVFRHAGGKDSIERSARTFSHGVWSRRDEHYARAFRMWMCVVLDNDAKHPDDFPNLGILASVAPFVVFVHQLAKRSIESYIPRDFLLMVLKRQQVYAIERLSSEQKQYYHMKKGFRFERNEAPTMAEFKQSKKVSQREKAIFGSIPQQDWRELRSGFGGGLSVIYVEEKYRPNANDLRFTSRQDREELMKLLKRIYERL